MTVCQRRYYRIEDIIEYIYKGLTREEQEQINSADFREFARKDQSVGGLNIPDFKKSQNGGEDLFTRAEAYQYYKKYYSRQIPVNAMTSAIAKSLPQYFDFSVQDNKPVLLGQAHSNKWTIISFNADCPVQSNHRIEIDVLRLVGVNFPEEPDTEGFVHQLKKVLSYLYVNSFIGFSEMFDSRLIGLLKRRLEYHYKFSRLVVEDLKKYIKDNGGKYFVKDVTSKDVSVTAGYDSSLNALKVLSVEPAGLIRNYLKDRFPQLLKDEGVRLYKQYRTISYEEQDYIEKLRFEKRDRVADLIDPYAMISPEVMYNNDTLLENFDSYLDLNIEKKGEINVALILIGVAQVASGYSVSGEYLDAQIYSKDIDTMGLWKDELFQIGIK